MSDSVLTLASEIYTTFEARESRRLREYVQDVEDLVGSAFFFHSGKQRLTISAEAGGPCKQP